MSDPKPFASLSPTLLARKGGAKPAMRPQLHYPDSLARSVIEDDLGWNDMGEEEAIAAAPVQGDVVPIKGKVELPLEPKKPMVLHHREEAGRKVATPLPAEPVAEAPVEAQLPDPALLAAAAAAIPALSRSRGRRSALDNGRRAAFTLRLDAERHLKLRLACTIRNRSAQQLITEALDRLIDELPDLATLATQITERR